MKRVESKSFLVSDKFIVLIVMYFIMIYVFITRESSILTIGVVFIGFNIIYFLLFVRKYYSFEYDEKTIIVTNGQVNYDLRDIDEVILRSSRGTYEIEIVPKNGDSKRFAVNSDEAELRLMVDLINKEIKLLKTIR